MVLVSPNLPIDFADIWLKIDFSGSREYTGCLRTVLISEDNDVLKAR
jgi:hypothetical protein